MSGWQMAIYQRKVNIRCPLCQRIQPAQVVLYDGDPYPTYIHECECGYIITESEWDEVSDE